jgi:hypothetical protein
VAEEDEDLLAPAEVRRHLLQEPPLLGRGPLGREPPAGVEVTGTLKVDGTTRSGAMGLTRVVASSNPPTGRSWRAPAAERGT